MDLIYTDTNRKDVGVLSEYSFDLAFGSDENNFQLTLDAKRHCMSAGCYAYIDGSEYGGIVDSVESSNGDVIYTGRTWHGILNSKIIRPDYGSDYLILSGDANTVLQTIITRSGIGALFSAPTKRSGFTLTNYQFPRYIPVYDAVSKMLKTVGARLSLKYSGSTVILSAVSVVDYSDEAELFTDTTELKIIQPVNAVNHLICLGKGELSARTVVDLYVDTTGQISQVQSQTGLADYSEVFDYPNAESVDELIEKGTDRLNDLKATNTIEVQFSASEDLYNIGDILGAYDPVLDVSASARIIKKIVSVLSGTVSVQYELGG